MKPSGIGGMAVMEGVMMRNKEDYAVAVRKPNNEIAVEKSVYKDFSDKVKLFKLPIFRGMLAFVDSMVIGVKVLNYSASFFEEEEEDNSKKKKSKKEKSVNKAKSIDSDFEIEEVSIPDETKSEEDKSAEKKADHKDDSTALMMAVAVLLSIALSVGLFMVLPVILTQFISHFIKGTFVMNLIEGIVRLAIFIGYVMLAALMPEIKRTFMYHGAEHKTINCLEHGYELTVENVRKQSKQHKRCGTSFMLLVILISLVFFMIVPSGNMIWRVLSRILLVPFIAGVSYEFIRLAGKSESKIVDTLSKPGLWMQGLTTKEPDDSMIEVAIQSVDAVYDWRAFLNEYKKDVKKSSSAAKKNSGNNTNAAKKNNTMKQSNSTTQNSTLKQVNSAKENSSEKKENKADNNSKRQSSSANAEKKSSYIQKENTEKQSSSVKLADTVKKPNNLQPEDNRMKEDTGKGNTSNRNKITPPSRKSYDEDEEDDEILKALDKYFDNREDKAAGGK